MTPFPIHTKTVTTIGSLIPMSSGSGEMLTWRSCGSVDLVRLSITPEKERLMKIN
jgi:hypothetical protein